MQQLEISVIARIHNDFETKFGIPRQSGLAEHLRSMIVFEPPYRSMDALRGLEEFSHLWLIWQFSQAAGKPWSPTVRPPRLGGNTRLGVFATRSPFRPNNLGLSCVKLDKVELHPALGPVLYVLGADLMDGTPIFDIKPYIPYADAHPEASQGFTTGGKDFSLEVVFPEELLQKIPSEKQAGLWEVLSQAPRPSYHNDPERIYGLPFGGFDIRFRVQDGTLTVVEII